MTFVSKVFLVLVVPVVVSYGHGEHLFNPCQNYRHGDHKYLFPDPLDCSKFYSCDAGGTPHHMDCPQGTSFDDTWRNGYGSCTGPDPRFVRDCYSNDRGDDDGDDDDDDCDDHYDDNRCDVKSYYNQWSSWCPCSVTCGVGTQTRTRTCWGKDHFPAGVIYCCEGRSKQVRRCQRRDCRGRIGDNDDDDDTLDLSKYEL